MIITICLNPTIQKTLIFSSVRPGEVNRACRQYTDASGKGVNVSRVLAQLGCEVTHLTHLGKDFAPWFCKKLEEENISLCPVLCGADLRTCSTIIEEEPVHRVTEIVEEGYAVENTTEEKIKKAFNGLLESEDSHNVEAVIISGSKAKGFSDGLFADIVEMSLEAGIPVVADYRGKDLLLTLERVEHRKNGRLVIKPNEEEFCSTFDVPMEEDCVRRKIKEVGMRYKCDVIITRGKKPLLAFEYKNAEIIVKEIHRISVDKKVINTIGCGDAFTAGFTSALVKQKSFEEAVEKGSECGALNACCVRPGSIR